MEGFKEFQGKDLDDAIGQACSYYDTLREKLEIDIIHDAKSGIFGIVGARKAKVKARRAQLRNAVDSILGRGRDEAGEDSPAPAKAARGQQQDRQGEKPSRSGDSRGRGRGDRPERSETTDRSESSTRPERPVRAEKADSHEDQPRQDRVAVAAQAEISPHADADAPRTASGDDFNRADSRSDVRADSLADTERKARTPRTGRAPAGSHNTSPHGSRNSEPRPHNGHGHGGAGATPGNAGYRYDGNSILSGQVQGYTPELEDDEEASFGPGNEMPPSHDNYDDRNAKPRRGRTPRPSQGRAEHAQPRSEHSQGRSEHSQGRPDHVQSRSEHSAPRAAATSILAGTLDSDALHEDALSEGLPVIPFDQLDQDRLCAISLEAVGRLVAPIVGDVPLSVELADNRVNVVLDCGDDSGLLIGREGQTLASLQYLASRLVSRGMGAAVRVQLDAGEYRLRQDEKLRDLALSLADRVRTTGKSHSTRPLSSYHRRIVHMALQEAVDIQTRSSGDGALKRVVIQKKRGS